ncbi:MAG: hypothetical protein JWR89_4769 [Tardiphaga sp.]|uniref:hypothetical protein n=1 Tax=Tardiphaga sp. TaxID=1926292 RepID=UPI00260F0C51|nr:hypothetical protein [Tardiphaga sp.]MDB5504867.1 hypothetical protein [Tardiphaga sp.]
MKHIVPLASLFALTLFSASVGPVFAADPVFPPGVRIGIAPLVGLAPAKTFTGFETSDQGVKVLMTELPAAAFGEVDSAFKTNPAMPNKPEGLETAAGRAYYTTENARDAASGNVRRYSMIVPGPNFSGYIAVQVPENAMRIYTDDAVRQMMATAVVRAEVPVEEQLGLLPFKITEMSGFKTVRTLAPGAALLLADSSDETKVEASPFMVVGTISSAPAKPEDRGRFAQQAATMIPGLRDGRITMSEPLRMDGVPGYETRLDAVSGKDNTPVSVVQWLRFGTGNVAMRIIASSPRDDWPAAFTRFRAVRDGIQPR